PVLSGGWLIQGLEVGKEFPDVQVEGSLPSSHLLQQPSRFIRNIKARGFCKPSASFASSERGCPWTSCSKL
ncbi:mCG142512, partial [Mus musculus]